MARMAPGRDGGAYSLGTSVRRGEWANAGMRAAEGARSWGRPRRTHRRAPLVRPRGQAECWGQGKGAQHSPVAISAEHGPALGAHCPCCGPLPGERCSLLGVQNLLRHLGWKKGTLGGRGGAGPSPLLTRPRRRRRRRRALRRPRRLMVGSSWAPLLLQIPRQLYYLQIGGVGQGPSGAPTCGANIYFRSGHAVSSPL